MQDIRIIVERPPSNHHGSPINNLHHHQHQNINQQNNHQQLQHLQQQQQQQQHQPQQNQQHIINNMQPNQNQQHQQLVQLQQQHGHLLQNSQHQQNRPHMLFSTTNLKCDENVNITNRSPSSEEDNSPTELNNCRRMTDKPPLVKRLTMGLLRAAEDSRPLVHNTSSSVTSGSSQTISDGYVNEGICDPDKIISSKFGDSCRKSLMSMQLDNSRCSDSEFDFKKHYLRETSSGMEYFC